MSVFSRILLSWVAVIVTAILILVVEPGFVLGRPDALFPVIPAWIFRYEWLPPLRQKGRMHRGLPPLILFLAGLHLMLFPWRSLLWGCLAMVVALWAREDFLRFWANRKSAARKPGGG